MTETSVEAPKQFLETWKVSFAKVLTQLGAAGVSAAETDASELDPAKLDKEASIQVNFSGGECLKGRLTWGCAKPVALQFAQLLMSEAIDPAAEFTANHTDGFQEFIRQVAGDVAVAWKELKASPAELTFQAEAPTNFESKFHSAISIDSDKGKAWQLRLDLDAELLYSLSASAPQPAAAQVETQEAAIIGGLGIPSNLSLILDVQLEATIRFGEREMLLRDVFGLMPGAVVELNQLVNEPAELLVAGRLIAKGEVVVVDGNFGLRVSEVVSPAQRAEVLSL